MFFLSYFYVCLITWFNNRPVWPYYYVNYSYFAKLIFQKL